MNIEVVFGSGRVVINFITEGFIVIRVIFFSGEFGVRLFSFIINVRVVRFGVFFFYMGF